MQNDEDRNLFINYKQDHSKKRHKWMVGLLGQEALAAEKAHTDKEQCVNHDGGHPEGWCDEGLLVTGTYEAGYRMTYTGIIMPLIKAVQELLSLIHI